jgi:hypothetical protein
MWTSPIHPQELCIVRRGFIQSNENRAMIGPRSVFPLLPAARSNAASSCIRLFSAAKSDNFHALDVLPTIHKRIFDIGSAH